MKTLLLSLSQKSNSLRWTIAKKALLLPIILIVFNTQNFSVLGQVGNYSFSTGTTGVLNPMTGSTQLVGASSDDGVSTVTSIGFSFTFNGTAYTQFSANANGLIRLGATAISSAWSNGTATSTTAWYASTVNLPLISPYWDDLATGLGGKVHTVLVGTAPNRIRIIEWFVTVPRNTAGTAAAKFQCLLYETTNVVQFVYGTGMVANATNSGASIGIANAISGANNMQSVSSSTNTSSLTVYNPLNTVAISSGRTYTFTPPPPPACSTPSSLVSSAVTSSSATISWAAASPAPASGYQYYVSTSATAPTAGTTPTGSTGAGVTTANLTGLLSNTTYYFWVRSNCGASGTSFWAGSSTFTTPAPAPSNDLVCNATSISCGATLSGTTVGATNSGTGEAGTCGVTQTMPGVWYVVPGNGQVMTASLCGTAWDSKMSVYSGASCSALTCIGGVDDGGPACTGTSASYSWTSVVGQNYYILVHGYSSNTAFSIALTCAAVVYNPCSSITNISACGVSTSFSIASGNGAYNPPSTTCGFSTPGQEKIYTFTPTVTGTYTINQTASFGFIDWFFKPVSTGCSGTGWSCIDDLSGAINSVSFTLTAGTQYYIMADPESTTGGSVSFSISCPVAAPANDLVCNATSISCGGTISGTTLGASNSGTGEAGSCGVSQTMPGVWYVVAGNGQVMTASLCGTIWDSKMSVYSGTSCSALTCIGGIDDSGPACASSSASYSWTSVVGQNYYILVHGYSTDAAFSISLTCTLPAPVAPTSVTSSVSAICAGSGSSVTLTANGAVGTVYWYTGSCGGTQIGTGNSIVVNPTSSTTYYARNYNNAQFSATCASATISVTPLPVVNAGLDLGYCPGSSAQLNATASSVASGSLTTTFAGGNGCGGGNMFDVVTSAQEVTINGFTITPYATGAQTVNVYYRTGTYIGNTTNSAAWTLLGSYAINGTAAAQLYMATGNIVIPASSTYGIYVQYNAQYTDGTNSYTNGVITVNTGQGHCAAFDGCCTPRTFNGIIHYTTSTTPTVVWTPSTGLSSASILNPAASPSSVTNYTITATANGCSLSDVVTVTPNTITAAAPLSSGDYIWDGSTSTDYTIVSNWLTYNGTTMVPATVAPSTTTNVILPSAQSCVLNQPALGSNTVNAQNVTIESGATLSLNNGTLNTTGHFVNNGTLDAGTGTVTFMGTTTQNIDGTNPTSFYNLTVNNNHTGAYPSHVAVKLVQDATVTNTLTLTDGILDVFDHVFTLGTTTTKATITPALGTADSYVAAHHNLGLTGYVKQFVHSANIGTAYGFPVGDDGKWTPFNLTFNAGSSLAAGSFITSRVNDALIAGSTNSSFSNRVVRDWEVEPSAGITTPNYTIEVFHNQDVLEFGGTASSGIVPFKLSGGTLYAPSASGVSGAAIVNQGTYTAGADSYTWSGLTTFSNFGGTEVISALPIELVAFQANCIESNAIAVTWTTASEHNTSHYVVEKSRDGNNWSVLGQTAAAGNSIELLNYEMIDSEKANGTTYYRLIQFDNDGVYEVFDPVSVNCNGTTTNNHIMTYPNPSDAGFYVSLFTETMEGAAQLSVMDGSGRIVYSTSVNIQDGNNVFHIGDMNAAPGMYYIQVTQGNTTTDIVKHSLR